MRIHRTQHRTNFTVMPNAVLRHPRLSLTARGLLGTLLSLPDGARETVETLCGKVEEGRDRVRKAMAQLETEGFIRRERQQREGGLWMTTLHVSDVPMSRAVPNDSFPTVGRPKPRKPVDSPSRRKEVVKKESLPPFGEPESVEVKPTEAAEKAEGRAEDAPQQQNHDKATTDRAAAFLAHLGRQEAKLAIGSKEAAKLAPLAAEWITRGVSELEMRRTLVAGLPGDVHSAYAILRHRLTDKLPAPRSIRDAHAPAVSRFAECSEPACRAVLPAGATGACRECSGAVSATPGPVAADPADWRVKPAGAIDVSAGRAKVRAALASV
ncbi:helix-turn-helix domain-containing protein [Streptomyces sioyaensis]|uniref:helix-turn-helix domain-containing protein n=1 Tax=Streptomyces TaxID=1883 RepID=UPI0036E67E17